MDKGGQIQSLAAIGAACEASSANPARIVPYRRPEISQVTGLLPILPFLEGPQPTEYAHSTPAL